MLSVSPASSLLDQEVRLETRLEDGEQGFQFWSVCDYQTESRGEFSTASHTPLPGILPITALNGRPFETLMAVVTTTRYDLVK